MVKFRSTNSIFYLTDFKDAFRSLGLTTEAPTLAALLDSKLNSASVLRSRSSDCWIRLDRQGPLAAPLLCLLASGDRSALVLWLSGSETLTATARLGFQFFQTSVRDSQLFVSFLISNVLVPEFCLFNPLDT